MNLEFTNLPCFCSILQVPVRLNGADLEYGGRVEVFYQGKWGKICRNKWNIDDAEVICQQLGFSGALAEFIGSDVKGEDSIPFVMSDVSCSGDEPELASCERIDGKFNVDCQKDGRGAQALCEPSKWLSLHMQFLKIMEIFCLHLLLFSVDLRTVREHFITYEVGVGYGDFEREYPFLW